MQDAISTALALIVVACALVYLALLAAVIVHHQCCSLKRPCPKFVRILDDEDYQQEHETQREAQQREDEPQPQGEERNAQVEVEMGVLDGPWRLNSMGTGKFAMTNPSLRSHGQRQHASISPAQTGRKRYP